MSWMSSSNTNEGLVQNLRSAKLIHSDGVYAAMLATDRGWYVTRHTGKKGTPRLAYEDAPQTIGYGATISAPHMHAMALEALYPVLKDSSRNVLDVGSGSGYLLAVLSRILGKGSKGKVVGVEHIKELVEFSRQNIEQDDKSLFENIVLHFGDGREGYKQHAPYHAIHVGAAADKIPAALLEQLAVGGILVIPVGKHDQTFKLIKRVSDNEYTEQNLCDVRYVPLTDAKEQLREFRM